MDTTQFTLPAGLNVANLLLSIGGAHRLQTAWPDGYTTPWIRHKNTAQTMHGNIKSTATAKGEPPNHIWGIPAFFRVIYYTNTTHTTYC